MRISGFKTLIQKPFRTIKNKYCAENGTKTLNKNNIPNYRFKIINKIKNLYYTMRENIYLAKYKLKEFLYAGDKCFHKIDKPTKTRLCQRIKPYLKSIFDNKVDPAKLDKKLTKLSGGNVREEVFEAKGHITIGRKKIYTMPNGKEIVLEAHNYKDPITNTETVVTRIYDRSIKKNRDYIDINGNFIHGNNGYKSKNAHLECGQKGIDWILAA